jgi:hypothetical protein
MAEETNDNQVSVTFNLVLDELHEVRENLVGDLTDSAQRSDYEAVVNLNEGLKKIDGLQKGVVTLKQEWDSIYSAITTKHTPDPPVIPEVPSPPVIHESVADMPQHIENIGRNYSSRRHSVASRLQAGIKTPNEAYEQPILEILVEMGGSGRSRDVLVQVKEKMKHELNSYDYEPTPTKKHVPRWQETAEWCRNDMVHKHGYLSSGSPRGIWEITDLGRTHLRQLQRGR